MFDQITAAYLTALFLICIGYVAGYIVGRLDIVYSALRILVRIAKGAVEEPTPQSPVMQSTANSRRFSVAPSVESPATMQRVDINETKFVASVSTAGMERAGTGELGKTTAVQDDIGASVSKLSQLKGK
jgi:hypothetical protein